MVPRLAGLVAVLAIAGTAGAQGAGQLKVEFDSEGEREVWIQDKALDGPIPEKLSVSGKAVQIELPEVTKDKLVLVHDAKTGNVATKPLDEAIKSGSWKVAKADEKLAYALRFSVRHEGRPVATAIVRLKVGERLIDKLVTEADAGLAVFNLVPFGDVQASVDYKSDGQDASTAPQTFESKPGMGGTEPFPLDIEGHVATVEEEAAEPTKGKEGSGEEGAEEGEGDQRPSPFATFFSMLVGLGVVGGIGYAVWRYVKANPGQTAAGLSKVGVHIPGDPSDPTPSAPKKAGPPQQIILENAAPTVVAPSAGPIAKNPRLVKADGSIFLVQDGTNTVGREAHNPLAIQGESSVSRHHADVVRSGDSVSVVDAGSTNGTFVNGRQITSPTNLAPGDTVQFGAVQYRYEE